MRVRTKGGEIITLLYEPGKIARNAGAVRESITVARDGVELSSDQAKVALQHDCIEEVASLPIEEPVATEVEPVSEDEALGREVIPETLGPGDGGPVTSGYADVSGPKTVGQTADATTVSTDLVGEFRVARHKHSYRKDGSCACGVHRKKTKRAAR